MQVDIEALSDMKLLILDLDSLMQLVDKYGEVNNKLAGTKKLVETRKQLAAFSTRVLIAQNHILSSN